MGAGRQHTQSGRERTVSACDRFPAALDRPVVPPQCNASKVQSDAAHSDLPAESRWPMLHAQKQETGARPGFLLLFHVEQDPFHCGHSRSGITTWRERALLASRTNAEELASRSWITMNSSRSADNASSR